MRYLLDTHALLYWWGDPKSLSRRAKQAIARPEHEVLVSAASAWEIATKVRIGKLPGCAHVPAAFATWCSDGGFKELAMTQAHALQAGSFAHDHRDPFDRMLVAQAMLEELTIITKDRQLAKMGATVLW